MSQILVCYGAMISSYPVAAVSQNICHWLYNIRFFLEGLFTVLQTLMLAIMPFKFCHFAES
jgi:hypothetical protein